MCLEILANASVGNFQALRTGPIQPLVPRCRWQVCGSFSFEGLMLWRRGRYAAPEVVRVMLASSDAAKPLEMIPRSTESPIELPARPIAATPQHSLVNAIAISPATARQVLAFRRPTEVGGGHRIFV